MQFNKLPPAVKYKLVIICGDKITCNICSHSAMIAEKKEQQSVNAFIKKHKRCKVDG